MKIHFYITSKQFGQERDQLIVLLSNGADKETNLTNPTMHDIPQCIIRNRNMHIFVLNGILWYMEQVHCGICEIGLL